MLHSLNLEGYTKSKIWCGPSAVSILAGIELRAATQLVCSVMKNTTYQELEGCHTEHVITVLGSLGYISKAVPEFASRYADLPYGPTLKRYLRERTGLERVTPLLIAIDSHFLTAHYDYTCDNWSKKPIPVETSPHLNKLVKAVFYVNRKLYA